MRNRWTVDVAVTSLNPGELTHHVHRGVIRHTMGENGQPLVAVVISSCTSAEDTLLEMRPVDALLVESDDDIITAVAVIGVDVADPAYEHVQGLADLPTTTMDAVDALASGVATEATGTPAARAVSWGGAEFADQIIFAGISRFQR